MTRRPQCQVEGCTATGGIVVYLAPLDVDLGFLRAPVEIEDLRVCALHAGRLGDIHDLDSYVIVDPVRAEGWRLMIIVRPSGRWATCLVAPEYRLRD